jgi:dTMP kinase
MSKSVAALMSVFIVIEGIDGAGTTTQARLLTDWMNRHGLAAHLTCEPSGGPVGRLIREYLSRSEAEVNSAYLALLFASDRLNHIKMEIAPKLEHGINVVSDRYVYSTFAYQSVDLALDWIAQINVFAPEPDLTVYLRLDPKIAAQRRKARGHARDFYETDDYQERISSNYDLIFGTMEKDGSWFFNKRDGCWMPTSASGVTQALQGPLNRNPKWVILDGSLPVEELQNKLSSLIKKICADA